MLMELISIISSHKCLLPAGRLVGIWVACGCQQMEVPWEVAQRGDTSGAPGGFASLGSAGGTISLMHPLQDLSPSSLHSVGRAAVQGQCAFWVGNKSLCPCPLLVTPVCCCSPGLVPMLGSFLLGAAL